MTDQPSEWSRSTPHGRKKRFSTKVRTGCVNCKARRIKCPEEKPECFKCLKSGILCTYAVPKANIFIPEKQRSRGQNCLKDFESTSKKPMFESGAPQSQNAAQLEVVTNATRTLYRVQPTYITFDIPSDRAAFSFWITWTAPKLNLYEKKGDFYKKIVPQFAYQSRAVKELVIAAVYADQHWLSTTGTTPRESSTQAFTHYRRALRDIQEGHTSKLETCVAALIAWTLETMLYNYKSGGVHLRGARTLIGELESETAASGSYSTYDLVHTTMRAFLVTSEAYQATMTNARPDIESNLRLMKDSDECYKAFCNQIGRYLLQYRYMEPTDAELGDILRCWENAVRTYKDGGPEPMNLNDTLHLLFLVATMLSPMDDIRFDEYGDRSKTLTHILTKIAAALRERQTLSIKDCKMLEETIKLILKRVFESFPDEQEWWVHRDLIQKIAQESHGVFEQTKVIQTLGVDFNRPPPLTVNIPDSHHAACCT